MRLLVLDCKTIWKNKHRTFIYKTLEWDADDLFVPVPGVLDVVAELLEDPALAPALHNAVHPADYTTIYTYDASRRGLKCT